jgi:NADH dehydrogenase
LPVKKTFRFRIAEVTRVDTESNTLETTIGNIAYDYLVIATGSTTNFFGNKDIEHYAMPMKSIPEALNLRYSILQNIEEALLKKPKPSVTPTLPLCW